MTVIEENVVNVAAYKFVELADLVRLRREILACCREWQLRGTVLLSREGINLFVAGSPENTNSFVGWLRQIQGLEDLEVKLSPSTNQPFTRMLVRLKKEIIALGHDEIRPREYTSRRIRANDLKCALDRGDPLLLLDVRNDYEVSVGTFEKAVPIGVDHFRDFPQAVERLPIEWRDKPIVMFCTGGIRCEKAGPVMEQMGFRNIQQLEGGILKYFEDVGGDHYQGDCFVFDKRVAVDPHLQETAATLCFACQCVLTEEDQQSPHYQPPHFCPHCYESPSDRLTRICAERISALKKVTSPLPGNGPYENARPLNVPARFDRMPVLQMLMRWHDHLPGDYWRQELESGRICAEGVPLSVDFEVRSGMRLEHRLPATSEPDVASNVEWVFEDDDYVVLNKPAPLPVHPCGRFSRNTLTYWLNQIYGQQKLRPAHRLDANTTGLIVFSRTRDAARRIQPLFETGQVLKSYLALVEGVVTRQAFDCEAPIGMVATASGGRQIDLDGGMPARTEFRLVRRGEKSLLECCPVSGRTNQIRLHLAHLGWPIANDPVYGSQAQSHEPSGTLTPTEPAMCLHAWKLEFTHPRTGDDMRFEAALPNWAKV